MSTLDYRTAGESHGQALVVLIEGMPAGVTLDLGLIDAELRRRQGGYGRGGRQQIETDEVNVLSGIRCGVTIGSPIAAQIANRDWRIDSAAPVHRPRPGHADLAGSLKWLTADCRNTLERASARDTAARVAAGAVAQCLLRMLGIDVVGYVTRIGPVAVVVDGALGPAELRTAREANDAYCPDAASAAAMIQAIRQAKIDRDTLGGFVEVQAWGVPPGLGSCARWQDKLDGRLAAALMSVPAVKGVEIGGGFELGRLPGSQVHDAIRYDPAGRDTPRLGFVRPTNRAGGLEGGMTNGQPIIVRAVMKPISTLLQGMESVDLVSKRPERSDYERSDVCAVPAASVIAENVVAFEIARALLEKFGGDTLAEVTAARESYLRMARLI